MTVLVTDPEDPSLSIECQVLGDGVFTGNSDLRNQDTRVAIVHQTLVDKAFLDQFPSLLAVIRRGVGFDKVDVKECERRGILVTNVPDYCTREVADTAMALILDLVRGIRQLEVKLRRDPQSWQSLAIPRIRRTSMLTLGVVGAGRIGTAVIERAQGFGFRCMFYDPFVDISHQASKVMSLDELLHESDIVSLHLPLNPQTKGMINDGFLKKMKRGAMLINTARGGLLADEQFVLDALQSGELAGAAFDVLKSEPPGDSRLFDTWVKDNTEFSGRLRITPHVAFYSVEAEDEVRRTAAEEAKRILLGEKPLFQVSDSTGRIAFSN